MGRPDDSSGARATGAPVPPNAFERGVSYLTNAERWARVLRWLDARHWSEETTVLAFAVAIGVISALGVVVFYRGVDLAHSVFVLWPERLLPTLGSYVLRPLVTALGLVSAWWIMHRVGENVDGLNVPDVQRAVVRRGGKLDLRPALARTVASAVTIGSGGSSGREGPVVVLGAAAASWFSRTLRFSPDRTRVLVGCGAAAAISAAFNAPLAGAFFALEEILGSFAAASFSPVVIASVIGAVVARGVFGNSPAFSVPEDLAEPSLGSLLLLPLLGVVCALVSAAFIRSYFGVEAAVQRSRWRGWRLALVGGAAVGLLAAASGGALAGDGHLESQLGLITRLSTIALVALTAGKIVATSITLTFGGSGGVFTPALFVGAATGGAFASAVNAWLPGLGVQPAIYALAGMGALVAGATGAPITGILLVFEMTNSFTLVMPLMIAVVIARALTRKLTPDDLYSGWLRRRGEHISHGIDRAALEQLQVRDAVDAHPVIALEATPLTHLLDLAGKTAQPVLPVIDAERRCIGVVTPADLTAALRHASGAGHAILAADLVRPSEMLAMDATLKQAMSKMGVRGAPALPVVQADGTLAGLLTRAHVLARYEEAISGESSEPAPPPRRSGALTVRADA